MKIEDFDQWPQEPDRWDRAMDAALVYQVALPTHYGFRLDLEARDYTFTRAWKIPRAMWIVGEGLASTRVLWTDPADAGIKILCAANGGDGSGSILQGLSLVGPGLSHQAPSCHAIEAWRAFKLHDAQIYNWPGNAVHIAAGSGRPDGGNSIANGWSLTDVRIRICGGSGVYTIGSDANAGIASNVNISSMGGWGIEDRSFLGNSYNAVQVAACTAGGFYGGHGVNFAAFFGCYAESGSPSNIAHPAVWLGRPIDNSQIDGGAPVMIYPGGALTQFPCVGDGVKATLGGGAKVAMQRAPINAQGSVDSQNTFRTVLSADGQWWHERRGANNLSMHAVGPAGVWAPRQRLIGYEGTAHVVREIAWMSPPTWEPDGGGTWARGDRVLNTRPDVTAVAGWIYDGASWRAYGELS